MFCGDISAGASNDILRATELARKMVCEWGMSESLGPINYARLKDSMSIVTGVQRTTHSEQTALLIDQEVRAIVDKAYRRAEQLIRENAPRVKAIGQALLQYETLTGEDVAQIMRGEEPEAARTDALKGSTGTTPPQPLVLKPDLSAPPVNGGLEPGLA
jgi:cell division protease FtsH